MKGLSIIFSGILLLVQEKQTYSFAPAPPYVRKFYPSSSFNTLSKSAPLFEGTLDDSGDLDFDEQVGEFIAPETNDDLNAIDEELLMEDEEDAETIRDNEFMQAAIIAARNV